MDIEKQREIVRLWNRMRRVEGPLAEEIRIQLLASFSAEAVGEDNRCEDKRGRWSQPGKTPCKRTRPASARLAQRACLARHAERALRTASLNNSPRI
jgi:hypothetical protein